MRGRNIHRDKFRYSVFPITRFGTFKVVSIIDSTNFQLHGLNRTIFAINTIDSISQRYFELDEENLLNFINDNLYKNLGEEEHYKLILFYNKVFSYINTEYSQKTSFYCESEKDKFIPLAADIRLSDIVSEKNIGKREYYEHAYKTALYNNGKTDYYIVVYRFLCDRLDVEHFLQLRINE